MDGITDLNVLQTLLVLLPGFLTAEIVGVLVLRADRGTFDRLVQALIYTFLSHVLWSPLRGFFPNNDPTNLLGLGICALIWGLVLTWAINGGWVHEILRKARLTRSASRPSEWYDAFYDRKQHVILHLRDGRRIFGWPRLYPVQSDCGHILLDGAEWLDRTSKEVSSQRVDFLIDVEEVRFVEFVPPKPLEIRSE